MFAQQYLDIFETKYLFFQVVKETQLDWPEGGAKLKMFS